MIIALLIMGAGFWVLFYTQKVVEFVGKIEFAERMFAGGGTYTFVKLVGLGMIIFPFMWMVGGLDRFLAATIGAFIPGL